MESPDLLSAAIEYAQKGLPVIPLEPAGKRPISDARLGLKGGFHAASTEISTLKGWWNEYPNANVGVVPPSDVLVLDVDKGEALPAVLTLAACLLKAPRVRTGKGGYHLYVRMPDGVPPPPLRSRLLPEYGLDIKGLGRSYLVAPPSIHPSGGEYRWVHPFAGVEDFPIIPPETLYLLHALGNRYRGKSNSTNPPKVATPSFTEPDERQRRYALAELQGRCREMEITPMGQRHSELVRHATALMGWVNAGALGQEDLKPLALAAQRAGLPEREVSEVLQWLVNVRFVRSL